MSDSPENISAQAYLAAAEAALRAGDLARAEQLLQPGLHGPAPSPAAQGLAGKVYFAAGRYEQAAAMLQEACRQRPRDAGLRNNLGSALQEQGRLDQSEEAFQQALALDPKDPRILCNLGLNFELRGQLPAAAERYQAALVARLGYVKALVGLGRIRQEQGRAQEAVNAYQAAIRQEPRTLEAHLLLGQVLVGEQKYAPAQVCFDNALRIDGDTVDAHLGLGEIHKDLGRLEQAAHCYRRACELGSQMACHFLAAVQQETTAAAPRQYVTELFDAYARDFESHLVGTLSYQTPKLLREALQAATPGKKAFPLALDLGCGTGLAGVEFRPLVGRIAGVDLSAEMLQEAKEKDIYSDLHAADIVEHLRGGSAEYDLFIAADVLVYVGALDLILSAVEDSARPGACFVFNVEHLETGDYRLQLNGRYAHSEAYVQRVAHKAGFSTLLCRPVPLRKENDKWVPGLIFVLKVSV